MKIVFRSTIVFFFIITSSYAQNWEGLGVGISAPYAPQKIFSDTLGSYLYIGGDMYSTTVDGRVMRGIGRWDGTKWDSLGVGLNNRALAFAHYKNKLYVGGVFDSAGYKKALSIATWDGSEWDSLSVQPFQNHSPIQALRVINEKLYVGGVFDTLNNQPCRGIAMWNDTTWTCMNFPPMVNTIYISTICEYNNEIYAAGLFYTSAYPNDTIQNIIRYDGTNWRSVGGGFKGSFSSVGDMTVYNSELYVAGSFTKGAGNTGDNIQKWNGSNWTEVGGGLQNGYVKNLLVHENKLYAVGAFVNAGGVPAQYIAAWDGTNWCSLGSNFDHPISDIAVFNDTLFIIGGFLTVDNDTVHKIAKWIGGNYIDTCGHIASGVNEITDHNLFSLYPNPSQSVINIEFENSISENYTISIVNVLGQIVYSKEMSGSKIQVSVDEIPVGIYVVQVQSKKGMLSKKFIKN